ncbi:MAG: tRNA pseudouridine(55) synthase TruB [Lachnospiraceae bacterium]|nr:tRNA pseudouridine(55) synthase TruB [Lachnospiraceae bacterium]
MYSGIINIYKEKGFTSHDVVAKLRGITKQKKIGHTGTLDPDAEGVLPVCFGNATKLCDIITDKSKEYKAVLLLGQETDTQDTSGEIINSDDSWKNLSEANVKDAINSFIGTYDQIPPMYSAIKINGKKLYELARAGEVVERKPRQVTIDKIEINEINLPYVTMTVGCSKGTYIRTLCHDIGEKLKCHGCMDSLLRTRVGKFLVEDSIKLSEVEDLVKNGEFEDKLIPPDKMFDYEVIHIKEEASKLIYNGNKFVLDHVSEMDAKKTRYYRVYDHNDTFVGIYERKGYVFSPYKMFL